MELLVQLVCGSSTYPTPQLLIGCYRVIILPAELSAAAVLIDYWEHKKISDAVWITVCLVVVVVINM